MTSPKPAEFRTVLDLLIWRGVAQRYPETSVENAAETSDRRDARLMLWAQQTQTCHGVNMISCWIDVRLGRDPYKAMWDRAR